MKYINLMKGNPSILTILFKNLNGFMQPQISNPDPSTLHQIKSNIEKIKMMSTCNVTNMKDANMSIIVF